MKIILILTTLLTLSFMGIWEYSKRFHMPSWLTWMVEIENPFAIENRSEQIISHLALKPNMIVADIGCGPGRVTLPLSDKLTEGKVLAVDLEKDMLERVRKKIGSRKNIELRQQNMGEDPLDKNTFDRILLVNLLGEIPNYQKTLESCYLSLKKEGIISVTETIFDPHFQNKKQMKKILEETGFKNINFFGPWYSFTVHGTKA